MGACISPDRAQRAGSISKPLRQYKQYSVAQVRDPAVGAVVLRVLFHWAREGEERLEIC